MTSTLNHRILAARKVILPGEVETYTTSGWHVIRMFQTSVPVRYLAKAAEYGTPSNNYQITPDQWLEQVAPVTMFVVARYRDDEMTGLREKAIEAAEAAEAAEYQRKDAEERAKKSAEAEANAAARVSAAVVRESSMLDRCRASEQKARDMETQIAKVRTALGELRMKEILGS